MFDWQDMRHFIALAETGTLSGAARALKVDHATVGRRVSALEQVLGTMLIERQPKRWVLTEAGQRVAALAQGMQMQAHALERAVRAQHAPLSGTVTVSTPPAFASHFLAPRLMALRRLYPDIHLSPHGQYGGRLAQPARGGHRRPHQPAARSEQRGPQDRDDGILALCRAGLYGEAEKDWEFVAYDQSLDQALEQEWLLAFADDRPIVFRTNSLACQIAAARAGMGIAALPCFAAYRDTGLEALSSIWNARFETSISSSMPICGACPRCGPCWILLPSRSPSACPHQAPEAIRDHL